MEHDQESSYLARLIKTRNDLVKEREVIVSKRDAITSVAKSEGRDVLTDDETTEFRKHLTEVKRIHCGAKSKDDLISDLDEENQRRAELREGAAVAARAQGKLESITEQATYTKGAQRSFFKDIADIALGRDLAGHAAERLRRHEQDVRTLPEYTEYRTGLDTTEGDGGSFTPPAYLLDQYITFARPGRPFADIVVNEAVPAGTMQVNIPKITSGTAVNWQATQNSALGETDLEDTYVTGNVCTIGGNQTVSRQLLDQAGLAIDQIVFRDLVAAHAQFLDSSLWIGPGSQRPVYGRQQQRGPFSGIQTIATGGLTIQLRVCSCRQRDPVRVDLALRGTGRHPDAPAALGLASCRCWTRTTVRCSFRNPTGRSTSPVSPTGLRRKLSLAGCTTCR